MISPLAVALNIEVTSELKKICIGKGIALSELVACRTEEKNLSFGFFFAPQFHSFTKNEQIMCFLSAVEEYAGVFS